MHKILELGKNLDGRLSQFLHRTGERRPRMVMPYSSPTSTPTPSESVAEKAFVPSFSELFLLCPFHPFLHQEKQRSKTNIELLFLHVIRMNHLRWRQQNSSHLMQCDYIFHSSFNLKVCCKTACRAESRFCEQRTCGGYRGREKWLYKQRLSVDLPQGPRLYGCFLSSLHFWNFLRIFWIFYNEPNDFCNE